MGIRARTLAASVVGWSRARCPDPAGGAAASAVVSAGLAVALVLAQLVTAEAVARLDRGGSVAMADLYRAGGARLGVALATVVGWGVVLATLFLSGLLVPVAVVLFVAWSLVLPVIQLEHRWGVGALRASWRLVRHQVGVVVPLLALAALLLSAVGGVLATLVFIAVPAPFGVVSVLPSLVAALVWPFIALLTTYAYYNGLARDATPVEGPVASEDQSARQNWTQST